MSKTIDLRRGYEDLSAEEKLYLAARGRLPKEHITADIREALNLSGEASNNAYGAHTGTVATMTNEQLEAELKRRETEAGTSLGAKGKKALMPDLDNPHSERLDYVEEAHRQKRESGEEGQRLAASTMASTGPVAPSLGAPGATQREEVTRHSVIEDDGEGDDEDEGLSPEDYATPDTETTNPVLRAEIVRRNEEREEAGLEQLSLDGNKAALVATLQADDKERASEEE